MLVSHRGYSFGILNCSLRRRPKAPTVQVNTNKVSERLEMAIMYINDELSTIILHTMLR